MKRPKLRGRTRDFSELAARDESVRRQFIRAELLTCRTALEMAEFSTGNLAVTAKELAAADKIVRVINRFLPKVADEYRGALETKLAELVTLRRKLGEKVRSKRGAQGGAR